MWIDKAIELENAKNELKKQEAKLNEDLTNLGKDDEKCKKLFDDMNRLEDLKQIDYRYKYAGIFNQVFANITPKRIDLFELDEDGRRTIICLGKEGFGIVPSWGKKARYRLSLDSINFILNNAKNIITKLPNNAGLRRFLTLIKHRTLIDDYFGKSTTNIQAEIIDKDGTKMLINEIGMNGLGHLLFNGNKQYEYYLIEQVYEQVRAFIDQSLIKFGDINEKHKIAFSELNDELAKYLVMMKI